MSERQKPSLAAEIVFASLIASVVIWYVWDAASASMKLENLILIAPAALLAFGALAFSVAEAVRRNVEATGAGATGDGAGRTIFERSKPLILLSLFVLYIVSMLVIGFDLATFLFIAASMTVSRKRRWAEVLVVSVIGSAIITYGFKTLIPYYQFPVILF